MQILVRITIFTERDYRKTRGKVLATKIKSVAENFGQT